VHKVPSSQAEPAPIGPISEQPRRSAATWLTSRRRLLKVTAGTAAGLVAASLFESRLTGARAPVAQSHRKEREGRSVIVQWDAAALAAMLALKTGPTVGARALAIVHTCMYDAWAAYDPKALGTQLGGALRVSSHRSQAAKAEAVSYAAYRALLDLFPSQASSFVTLLIQLGYDPSATSTDTSTPVGIGNVAAKAELAFRHGDGSNQLGGYADTTGYVPVNDPTHINDPNRWQPLLANGVVQKFVTPQWGLITPFALTSGAQLRPDAPERYPSNGYRDQAADLLAFSAGLTDTQKVIAEYWASVPGAPAPMTWAQWAQFIAQRDKHELDDDVKLFFALTNAFADALIAVWDAKRAYDSERPVTAIHYLFTGTPVTAWGGPFQGTQVIDGGAWKPYLLATPPFPEYVSAHSAVSAASAHVLARFTESDAFGGSITETAGASSIEPGLTPARDVTLSWATFSEAADQAGISRRYGGIHFEEGDLRGRALGRAVGELAWKKAQSYIRGGD
jgi:Domain of unknown function (DUF6851)/VCPO second helical-bundle domain